MDTINRKNNMKKRFYIPLALLLMLLPLGACNDATMSDDLEEPFEDPIPLEELEENSSTMFTNPLMHADMPDPSVVRVGNDYYMISTTMHMVPGVAVLHSTDLVGWEIVGHVFNDKLGNSPAANFETDPNLHYDNNGQYARNDLYAQGSWASSLAYHDGYFYCLWNIINDDKSYISRTTDPAGTWEVVQEYSPLFYDAALFFDDDGTPYIFKAHGETITKLNADLSINSVIYTFADDRGIYNETEGYHVRKVNGYYYIIMIMWVDYPSVICLRSEKIEGPYTSRMVLHSCITTASGGIVGGGVAQGTLVDTPDGKWYGLFGTTMGSVGRSPVLAECNFKNGWPIFGNENGEVDEEMVVPIQSGRFASSSTVVKSDDFTGTTLKPFWEWNHSPDKNNWSLTKNPGHLRLTTGHVATDFFHARNTLTCRTMGPSCRGDISIDFSHMKNGDYAGLGIMQYRSGLVGVKMVDGKYYIFMSKGVQNAGAYEAVSDGDVAGAMTEYETVEINQTTASLRVVPNFDTNTATFYYSLGNNRWTQIGETMKMTYILSNFVGNRFAIFNYATSQVGGYVDVDSFAFVRRY